MPPSETNQSKFETALWESQRVLSTLLSNLPGAAYRCLNDRSWTMDFISDGVYELTGYRPEDILSGRISFGTDIIHADDRQAVWEQVQRALTQRERFRLVYRFIHASGKLRWAWEQGLGIFDSDGELVALEGFITDISERMEAQQALERQRFFLNQVIDIMPHFVFAKDREGRFTLVNRAVAEAYGTTIAELVGKTDSDFNPNAEEVAHFRRDDLEVMDSGAEKLIPAETITDAAGNLRILQTIKRPLPDIDGSVNHMLGVATDITQLKQAEQRAAEAAEWLRLAQESAHLGTFEWDTEAKTGRCSLTYTMMHGLGNRDEMPSWDEWIAHIHPEDREAVKNNFAAALGRPGEPFSFVYRVIWPDGQQHTLRCRGSVIASNAGGPRMIGAVTEDS